jgi:hypothetical protein
MKFHHELRYDAGPEEVFAMLGEPHFRERVCDAMRAIRFDVTIESQSEGMSVQVDQAWPAHGFPSFAKKFVGDEIRIVQKESWADSGGADLEVVIPGKPGHLKGEITLAADGDGTVETVSGEIRVHIPVVGGKIESLVGNLLGDAMDTEQKVGQTWLAEDHV